MKRLSVKILVLLISIIFLQFFSMRILLRVFGYLDGGNIAPNVVELWTFIATFISLLLFIGGVNTLIISRIRKLSEASRRVAKGDFDIHLENTSQDELGSLVEDFNLMARELKSNEYLSRDFVKNFSHELKTPISSIKGYAELIEQSSSDQEISEYAKIIRLESVRLTELSQNLLKISRLDSNVIIKQEDTFLLDEQIRRVILVMQSIWEAKQIEFELNLQEIQIQSNDELLFIVWQNLLSNAVKFSSIGGKIVIDLKLTDRVQFSIRDYGCGISDEDGKNIFNEFFIADKARNKSGSGLGMVIAKKIIDKLNGKISFQSTVGEGSTFFVELPKTDKICLTNREYDDKIDEEAEKNTLMY